MKYYSEILNRKFDTVEECNKAEKEYTDRQVERGRRIQQERDEWEEVKKAFENAYKLYRDFNKKYPFNSWSFDWIW